MISVLLVDVFVCIIYCSDSSIVFCAPKYSICTWRRVVFIYQKFCGIETRAQCYSNIRFKTKQKRGSSVISTLTRLLYLYFSAEGVRYNAGMFLHDFSRKCVNRPWRPIGLWDVDAPTFSRQSARRWRWGCQPYAPAALHRQEDSWYSFLLEADWTRWP
jgi:hypothetical protein